MIINSVFTQLENKITKNNMLETDETVVYAKIPKNIDNNILEKHIEKIEEYFNELSHDRIHIINGYALTHTSYICDYCKSWDTKVILYCIQCHQDMCNLCYEETNEEIAIKNGAKKYKLREDRLKLCRT